MATEFNPNDAVEQQPEAQESNFSFKVEGYENENTVQEAQEAQSQEANANEIGVEPIVEDAPAAPQQEEIHTEAEASEEVVDVPIQDIDLPLEQESVRDEADLPDWLQKLKNFHEDTGGGIEEYQKYTQDIDSLDEKSILAEYYKNTKPHYSDEDINLFIDEKFGIDEDYYEEGEELSREDKLKRMAMKDELIKAKQHLSAQKEKYYSDLKSGVADAPEQYKEAVEFYTNSQKQQEQTKVLRDNFMKQSKDYLLNEEFRGFTFDAGEAGKFRLNPGPGEKVLEYQADINDLLNGMFDENGQVHDVAEYHKSLWAAQNVDKIFQAAFEQGRSSALKERTKATKNPDYSPNSGQSESPKKSGGVRFLDTKW